MKIVLEAGDEEWLTRVVAAAIRQAATPTAPQVHVAMTLTEVADHTRIPENTLRYWRARGHGGPPSHKRGRRIYYDRDEVDAWMAADHDASSRPFREQE